MHDVWMLIGHVFMEFICTYVCTWSVYAWDMCVPGIYVCVYSIVCMGCMCMGYVCMGTHV